MTIVKIQVVTLLFTILCQHGQAQGTFQNLNFEQATIVYDPSSGYDSAVYASDAIPGWIPNSFLGANDILYNVASIGSASVSILGTNGTPPALDGKFSVYLYGGASGAPGASISQSGLVPSSAKSILFEAQHSGPPGGTLLVSLGGQNISFSAMSTGPNYTVYGGDVSPFAGQTEQLMFSALRGFTDNFWEIDNIQFSDSSIPEPSVFGISAVGALLLGWRVVRRRR